MKKLFLACALFLGIITAQSSFADQNQAYDNQSSYDSSMGGNAQYDQNCCPPDQPCDQPLNDCWCRYVHYKPCYYTTQRCVEEKIPCKKNCVRYVPKYYQVQRCRYVPEYYNETYCRQEPEYYCVDDCKTCTKVVCDQHCKMVPEYYWKHICGNTGCPSTCPAQSPSP